MDITNIMMMDMKGHTMGIIEKIVWDLLMASCRIIAKMSEKPVSPKSLPPLQTTSSPKLDQEWQEVEKTAIWVEDHYHELQVQYGGEWIVADGESVVAHDVDMIKADESATEKGASIHYLVRIRGVGERSRIFIGYKWKRGL